MAFPGTYNINYYRGDTFEFRIYPKDTSGAQFNLTNYLPPKFKISTSATSTTQITGYAEIVNNQYILCTITPTNGAAMVAGTRYVYDVEIGKNSLPYNYVYTLLTGTITVSEQVNKDPLLTPPNIVATNALSPSNAAGVTNTTATIAWTAPAAGSEVTGYRVYRAINPLDPENTKDAGTPLASNILTYTFSGLTASNPYSFGVAATNAAGIGPINWIANYTAPNAPVTLNVSNITETSAKLTWVAPTNTGPLFAVPIVGYKVYLGDTLKATITLPATLEYTFNDLTPSTLYSLKVSTITSLAPLVGTYPPLAAIDPQSRESSKASITTTTSSTS